MSNDIPVKLVTTKPDQELANELRQELIDSSKTWLDACTKAHKLGFIVQASFAPNFLGQYIIQQINLSKQF